jgi:hypothetical protein
LIHSRPSDLATTAEEGIVVHVKFPRIVLVAVFFLAIQAPERLRGESTANNGSGGDGSRTPVLIELFTSEGCSDCPPADALLQELDRSQPIQGVDLIVLSEHVDYWDDDGWRDPYSSHAYSERQRAYANHLALSSVYTPQMVVDGRFELVGSDRKRAIVAIENATKAEKIPVRISSIRTGTGDAVAMRVEAGELPSSIAATSADVLIATADESDESHVSRGENAGRTLRHVAVLRSITRVGIVNRSSGFSREISVNVKNASTEHLRIVVILQETAARRVLGVGSARLSN